MAVTSPARVSARVLSLVLCAAVLAGCSSYDNRSMLIKQALVEENYEAALENVEKIGKSSSELLYLYEKGLVLHYQNRFAESNKVFEEAEVLFEDLYTKSVSREVAALVVKDDIAKYRGEPFEAVFVNYYKILNYLHQDDLEGALVECRRVNRKLQMIADAAEDGDEPFIGDPFVQYLTAMVYEAAGDLTDAAVSYRAAVKGYDTLAQRNPPAPRALYCDAARVAEILGDFDEADGYREAAGRDCPRPPRDWGEVNLFLEGGYVTHKVEASIVLPIFESDSRYDDDELARRLAQRRHDPPRRNVKITQVVKVAVPVLAEDPVPFTRAEVTARPDSAAAKAQPVQAAGMPVDDLGVHARRAFEAQEGRILVRTIVRALAKLAAQNKAREENATVGALVNVFNVATETADTRCWSTLPRRIEMARMSLPPGVWKLDVRLVDGGGAVVHEFTIPSVRVRSGAVEFLNYRVY